MPTQAPYAQTTPSQTTVIAEGCRASVQRGTQHSTGSTRESSRKVYLVSRYDGGTWDTAARHPRDLAARN